jgi:chemotaxis protein MotB
MAGAGGGAWKVAYADFVTAMMAFFMVMWITAQNKQMKIAVAHYFNDPFNSKLKTRGPQAAGSTTTGPLTPGSRTVVTSAKPGDPPGPKKSKDMPPSPGRKIQTIGPKSWSGTRNKAAGIDMPTFVRINNGSDPSLGIHVLFGDDSKELNAKARQQLTNILPLLIGHRQKIELRGHARQHLSTTGLEQDAWGMSYARCVTVMKFLVDAGIEADRMRLSQAGPNEPHSLKESSVQNSCVDLIVLPELVEDFLGTREEREKLGRSP